MFKKIQIFILVLLLFAIPSFSIEEGYDGILFDDIPGTTPMHTASWINENFENVSNQIGQVQTNLDNATTELYGAISVQSNRIDNINTNINTITGAIIRITQRLDSHDTSISNLESNLTFVSNNVTTNYDMIVELQGTVSNFEYNVSTNFDNVNQQLGEHLFQILDLQTNLNVVSNNVNVIHDSVTNLESVVEIATNELHDVIVLTIPTIQSNLVTVSNVVEEIVNTNLPAITQRLDSHDTSISNLESNLTFVSNNVTTNYDMIVELQGTVSNLDLGISIVGATGADADYSTNKNISTMIFDRDSGFTVTTNDLGERTVEISLGSAWTTLVPDISQIDPETGESYPNLRPSGEETLHISMVKTNEYGTFWDYSNTNKNEKTFYIGYGNVPDEWVYTTEAIVVTNLDYPIGRYTNGMVIPTNTSLKTILGNMFTKVAFPTYTNLAFRIVPFTNGRYFEFGQDFAGGTVIVSGITTLNDAGPVQKYEYRINNELIDTTETTNLVVSYTNGFFYVTNDLTYDITVYWSDGPIKTDSDGNPYPTGQIKAGHKSDSFTIRPTRRMYWGNNSIPVEYVSPDAIYALRYDSLISDTTTLTIPLTQGTRQTIFAVPTTVNVTYMNFSNSFVNVSILDKVTVSEISGVLPENGYTGDGAAISYNVYDYKSSSAIEEDNTDFIVIKYTP